MFGQFSTCDLVEFQRLLWSGGRRDLAGQAQGNNGVATVITQGGVGNNTLILGQQQQQFVQQQQQPTIISGIHQPVGSTIGVITTNTNPTIVQNNMPVARQHNFLNNQSAVSFTTQPTTRYIPNQPQARGMNQHNSIQLQQQQTQPHFSQIVPLDLGKQAQEARAREMVPEFEEQYFIQSSSPTKVSPVGRGQNQTNLHRPQPHIPNPQAISDHLARAYPQQQQQQKMYFSTQETHHSRRKPSRHEMYEPQIPEMEVDDHRNDTDYTAEEDDDDEDEEYEEYEPVPDEGPWKCGYCRKIYKRKANFLQHQETHKAEAQAQAQQQAAQQQAMKCEICQECFLTQPAYARHMKNHEKGKIRRSPGAKPSSQKQLQAAISSITGGSIGNPRQHHQYQSTVLFHFKCEFCPEQFSTQQELKGHEQLHLAESTLRCVNCDKPFLREEEFNQHIKTHLTESVWKCAVCTTVFEEYKAYKDHLQSHLPVVYKDPPPKPATPEKPVYESKAEDDDIMEMEVVEEGADKTWSPKKDVKPSTSRTPSSRSLPPALAKARYATGSNMKVTGKAGREIIRSPLDPNVKRIPNPNNPKQFILVRTIPPSPSTSAAARQQKPVNYDDGDDDDVMIVSESATPHRPIPIRRVAVPQNAKKNMPVTKAMSKQPVTPIGRRPAPNILSKKPLARIKEVPARKTLALAETMIRIEYKCIICNAVLPDKRTQMDHILKKHCSEKSIEIILLRLEDDPALDLEIIDDDDDNADNPS